MPTIFSRIVKGEIPSYKIAEDDKFYAFLDINPLAEGHTLVIPKTEVDYLFDLDDDTLTGLTLFSKRVAKAIERAIPCKRIGVAVLGLEVPHAHIHIIPRFNEDGLRHWPGKNYKDKEMEDISKRIKSLL